MIQILKSSGLAAPNSSCSSFSDSLITRESFKSVLVLMSINLFLYDLSDAFDIIDCCVCDLKDVSPIEL